MKLERTIISIISIIGFIIALIMGLSDVNYNVTDEELEMEFTKCKEYALEVAKSYDIIEIEDSDISVSSVDSNEKYIVTIEADICKVVATYPCFIEKDVSDGLVRITKNIDLDNGKYDEISLKPDGVMSFMFFLTLIIYSAFFGFIIYGVCYIDLYFIKNLIRKR